MEGLENTLEACVTACLWRDKVGKERRAGMGQASRTGSKDYGGWDFHFTQDMESGRRRSKNGSRKAPEDFQEENRGTDEGVGPATFQELV